MIKIVAHYKFDGSRETKQFSTSKNRLINEKDLLKLRNWIEIATIKGRMVEINYKITFDKDVDRRFNHMIAAVGCKTYVKQPDKVDYTINNIIKDLNRQIRK